LVIKVYKYDLVTQQEYFLRRLYTVWIHEIYDTSVTILNYKEGIPTLCPKTKYVKRMYE